MNPERNSPAAHKEMAPAVNTILVFRIRHGNTVYKEQLQGLEPSEKDITPEGAKEMQQTAHELAGRLSKDEDVVVVVSSPARRAQDSADILRAELEGLGFHVWKDPKAREIRSDIRNTDMRDETGSSVLPQDDRYASAMQEILAALNQQHSGSHMQAWKEGGIQTSGSYTIEPYGEVAERARRQIALVSRIGRKLQPTIDKRIVVIQVEHGETVDELLDQASGGMKGIGTNNILSTGGILELEIPTAGQSTTIAVRLIDRNGEQELLSIEFDQIKREFLKDLKSK